MNFIVLLFYLLIYFIRPAEWVYWLRLNWQMYFGVLAIVIICMYYIRYLNEFFEEKYGLLVFSFFGIALLSKALTGWFGGVVILFNGFLPSIVVFFLIQIACTDDKKLKHVMTFVLCLVATIGVSAIYQHKTGEGFGGITSIERVLGYDDSHQKISTQQVRWYGVFNDPNDLGMIFVAFVPFALQQLLRKHILYLLPLVLIIIGAFLTNSRGTFVALIISVVAYFLLKTKNMKGLVVSGVLCSVLILLGPSRIGDINASEDSAIGRLEAWIAAFQMFKQSPIFGVGPDNFTDYYFITAHNSYMLSLAETGLFGLMCFIGITIIPAWHGLKMVFGSTAVDTDENLIISVLSGFLGICISMFFISRTYTMVPYMMSSFVIASMKLYNLELYKQSLETVRFYSLLKVTMGFIVMMFCIAKLT